MSQDAAERNERIAEIAGQFLTYIDVQTGSAPPSPEAVTGQGILDAFAALDESLNQLADLADVYGSDRLQSLEPLVLPAAALIGEYLRYGADAAWLEPVIDADSTLVIAMPDGIAVDLTGAVRASLFSGMANLKVMVDRLINPESS